MTTINHWELPQRSALQRGLALAQQLKDTANILLFLANGYLFFGVLVGIAIPGLVLFALRWSQLKKQGSPGASAMLWLLSLGHELLCANMFAGDHPHIKQGENDDPLGHFEPLYFLGAAICLIALLNLGWEWLRPEAEE